MIQYDRLWATMTDRGMTQYKLIKLHGFSAGQIGRMKKNMHVSTHTLETLCRILNCRIEDIVEYTPEEAAPAECTHSQHRFAHSKCSGTQAQREHPGARSDRRFCPPEPPGLQL